MLLTHPRGFDNERYLAAQTKAILERAERFGAKLYLEFGGKLLYDYHASRVLPGYGPNVKVRLLQRLRDAFGKRAGEPGYSPALDLNGDGQIGFADFLILMQGLGERER